MSIPFGVGHATERTDTLECGHVVGPKVMSAAKRRRCPSCPAVGRTGAVPRLDAAATLEAAPCAVCGQPSKGAMRNGLRACESHAEPGHLDENLPDHLRPTDAE